MIKTLLKTQTTILNKLAEQKQERYDQQHAISPCESNFLQQQEVQQIRALLKQHTSQSSKT